MSLLQHLENLSTKFSDLKKCVEDSLLKLSEKEVTDIRLKLARIEDAIFEDPKKKDPKPTKFGKSIRDRFRSINQRSL